MFADRNRGRIDEAVEATEDADVARKQAHVDVIMQRIVCLLYCMFIM